VQEVKKWGSREKLSRPAVDEATVEAMWPKAEWPRLIIMRPWPAAVCLSLKWEFWVSERYRMPMAWGSRSFYSCISCRCSALSVEQSVYIVLLWSGQYVCLCAYVYDVYALPVLWFTASHCYMLFPHTGVVITGISPTSDICMLWSASLQLINSLNVCRKLASHRWPQHLSLLAAANFVDASR